MRARSRRSPRRRGTPRHPGHAADDGVRRRRAAAATKAACRSTARTPARRSTAAASRPTSPTSRTRRKWRSRPRAAWARRRSAGRRSASCPRPAATAFEGQVYLSGVHDAMVGSNYTDELKDRGAQHAGRAPQAVGLQRRRAAGRSRRTGSGTSLTLRDEGQHRSIPGIYPNLNAGDPDQVDCTCRTRAGRRRAPRAGSSRRRATDAARRRPATSSTSTGTSRSRATAPRTRGARRLPPAAGRRALSWARSAWAG